MNIKYSPTEQGRVGMKIENHLELDVVVLVQLVDGVSGSVNGRV